MDSHHRQQLMISASLCGGSKIFRPHGGLRDLIDHRANDTNDPVVIAARILDFFCVENGTYNGFQPGVSLAVQFLNLTCSDPPDGYARIQALTDLKAILTGTPTVDTLEQWARSHY